MTSVKKTAGPAELFQSGSASQNKVKEDRGLNTHIMKSLLKRVMASPGQANVACVMRIGWTVRDARM